MPGSTLLTETIKSDRFFISSLCFPEPGCLQWINVAQSSSPGGFWSVVIHNINVGGVPVLRSQAPAILDTGTSLIVGPFDDVAYLANEIGAECLRFHGADSSSYEEVSAACGCSLPAGWLCHVSYGSVLLVWWELSCAGSGLVAGFRCCYSNGVVFDVCLFALAAVGECCVGEMPPALLSCLLSS